MAKDYLIGIGGTGARCAEALIYLTAAGLFKNNLHLLLIDPDQNNGNSEAAKRLVESYALLHRQTQPANPQRKRMLGIPSQKLDPPTLFRARINRGSDDIAIPVAWHSPNDATITFSRLINHQTLPDTLKAFLDLFYTHDDLDMTMEAGYRGRTNVGSVALKQDLENTAALQGNPLNLWLRELNRDLNTEPAKVFVIGSLFGGTGAAGLPIIPALIKNLDKEVLAVGNREKILYGCAMMSPYFSFPGPEQGAKKHPGIDSTRHAIATQAALHHYARVPPSYQRAYLIGAPQRPQTNDSNVSGGSQQKNKPHYAEIVAALAGWDFFSRGDVQRDNQTLHYADTLNQQQQDDGVRWENLPLSLTLLKQRDEIKQRLVVFTTFAYFYQRILHRRFIERDYQSMNVYRHNFRKLSLDLEAPSLAALNDFLTGYLNWLRQVGETGNDSGVRWPLFNWEAFNTTNPHLCSEHLGNLMMNETVKPLYAANSYDQILRRLDGLTLTSAETNSATGLFIYLLWHAVNDFCFDNYYWTR
ncbi:MAG: hypothetical protein ACREA2_04035 [Blastocatellia bacterium]